LFLSLHVDKDEGFDQLTLAKTQRTGHVSRAFGGIGRERLRPVRNGAVVEKLVQRVEISSRCMLPGCFAVASAVIMYDPGF
jgi:hypothetical protein